MLMQNFFAMGLLGVLWVLLGFTLAFGNFGNGGWIGNFDYAGFKDVGQSAVQLGGEIVLPLTIPFILFAAYQMTFAIITPALITGAIADRMKFGAYARVHRHVVARGVRPGRSLGVRRWVVGEDLGALDFAGGAVVHINAGAAALALAILLGRRKGWPREGMHPHNLTLTLIGTGILVVRVGRFQRRLGARPPAGSPPRRSSTPSSPPLPDCSPGCCSSG